MRMSKPPFLGSLDVKVIVILLLFLGVALATSWLIDHKILPDTLSPKVNSFQSCAQAGYPIMESSPRKCRSAEVLTFTEYEFCTQVISKARNPQSGEIREFPTPCDVPQGWEKM